MSDPDNKITENREKYEPDGSNRNGMPRRSPSLGEIAYWAQLAFCSSDAVSSCIYNCVCIPPTIYDHSEVDPSSPSPPSHQLYSVFRRSEKNDCLSLRSTDLISPSVTKRVCRRFSHHQGTGFGDERFWQIGCFVLKTARPASPPSP